MPNWCLNKLTVSHTDKTAMERFINSYNKGTICNEFIPEPKSLSDEALHPDGWYMWRVNNWGTKWDIGADEGTEKEERYGLKATVVGNEASCSFDSAWSPPIGLYDKLVELGYKVHASYFEPGMTYCGIYTDGYDNYIEYKTKEGIPVGIWNDFDLQDEFFEETKV
jgi:hypothetical protein